MSKIIRSSGLIIPQDYPIFEEIKNDLTRKVIEWDDSISIIKFYEELKNGNILIPRYYNKISEEEIEDKTKDGEDIEIEHNIIARNSRQENIMNFFPNRRNGILQVEPGTGKTVMTISFIATIKKKSVIIAHKDSLLDQWKDEFIRHTNLKEEDIGRLYTNNYEEILKKKIILSTPHIFANAMKKKDNTFLKAIFDSNIGILIIDECHMGIGPEHFSKASLCINAKRTFGLSATPKRTDGTHDILESSLGKVVYFKPDEGELTIPKIFMYYVPFGICEKYIKYISYGGKFQESRYYKQMAKVDKYITYVSKIIKSAYDNGRVILVLGKRIESLLNMAEASKLPPSDVGIFIPGAVTKKHIKIVEKLSDITNLKDAFKTKQVVFSTYGACRDGNNREDLDVLIMTCPTSNVEQAVGRILRKLDGKKQPIVIDLVDTEGPKKFSLFDVERQGIKVGWFERQSEKRRFVYDQLNWIVEEKRYPTKKG